MMVVLCCTVTTRRFSANLASFNASGLLCPLRHYYHLNRFLDNFIVNITIAYLQPRAAAPIEHSRDVNLAHTVNITILSITRQGRKTTVIKHGLVIFIAQCIFTT